MKTYISSLTIVNQRGTQFYKIGNTYNGMVLFSIEDVTEKNDNFYIPIYEGYGNDGLIFRIVNCPVEIKYSKEKKHA